MSIQEQAQAAAPLAGGGSARQPQAPESPLVDQRRADKVLLVETLADYSSDERLVTADELLAALMERAAKVPPVTVAQVREELENLPDPRFEGPDSQTVAADMARIKAMEKAQPGSAPDPQTPGLRQTRRLLSRRQLLTSLLHPSEATAAQDSTDKDAEASPSGEGGQSVAAGENGADGEASARPRVMDRGYAASLLAELAAEDDDVAVFTAWDGKEYYHYKPQMSGLYARILSAGNNRMVQLADVVRESSRDYPRPVPLEIFEYPPFLFEAEILQQCLRAMADDPEYADIKFTESSVGTVYLYSRRYLDADYAEFLAEKEDVGAIASP